MNAKLLTKLAGCVAEYLVEHVVDAATLTVVGAYQLRHDVQALLQVFCSFSGARHWPMVKPAFNK